MLTIKTVEEYAVFQEIETDIYIELMRPKSDLSIRYKELTKDKTKEEKRLIQAELIFNEIKKTYGRD